MVGVVGIGWKFPNFLHLRPKTMHSFNLELQSHTYHHGIQILIPVRVRISIHKISAFLRLSPFPVDHPLQFQHVNTSFQLYLHLCGRSMISSAFVCVPALRYHSLHASYENWVEATQKWKHYVWDKGPLCVEIETTIHFQACNSGLKVCACPFTNPPSWKFQHWDSTVCMQAMKTGWKQPRNETAMSERRDHFCVEIETSIHFHTFSSMYVTLVWKSHSWVR